RPRSLEDVGASRAPGGRRTCRLQLRGRSGVPSAPKAGEDLPPDGVVPVPEGVPDCLRCDGPRSAAQNSVVTAKEDGRILRVGEVAKPWIRFEGRRRPLPDLPDTL